VIYYGHHRKYQK